MYKHRSQTWHWPFDEPASVIWGILADTARFNEAGGFPPHAITEEPQPDGSLRYFAQGSVNSYELKWEEIPANWVEECWFTHERHFSKGPFREVNARINMEVTATGCICHYTLQVQPANLIGQALIATGFFSQVAKKFGAMADHARLYAAGTTELPFLFEAPQLAPGARERSAKLATELAESPFAHQLQDRLVRWILDRPDADVWTLRPKALARQWQLPEMQVIELCLVAASKGLLNLRWDLLCPNCRISKSFSTRMDEIPQGTHCSTCNIDYQRDFNRNVELAFLPSRSLRPLHNGEYCLFGPISTPHIKVQLRVEPGATRNVSNPLQPGHYRLRTLEPGNEVALDWNTGHPFPAIRFDAGDQLTLVTAASSVEGLQVHNASTRPRTLIIEHRAWMQDVLTAQQAATLQCFRDLYHDQVLRPGDFVEIDNVVLMFTDIKASTALYNTIGDAAAYALVREHFAILGSCVRRHEGSIVKTIGDAIMAAFSDPLDGVLCAFSIQAAFAAFNAERSGADAQVVVKLGMHMGPCIAVTLNGILDYYGKVANLTARLAALAEGNDLVVSNTLANDPAVKELLAGLDGEHRQATLKGFDEPVAYSRFVRP